MNRLQQMQALWRARRAQSPSPVAFAKAPTPRANKGAPDPSRVTHMFSIVFVPGTRHFAFASVEDREEFLSRNPGTEACEDPVT